MWLYMAIGIANHDNADKWLQTLGDFIQVHTAVEAKKTGDLSLHLECKGSTLCGTDDKEAQLVWTELESSIRRLAHLSSFVVTIKAWRE